MFEIGFAELFLLGVIALLVVGPDRLPALARTVGVWVGRAQRLVGQVRADIEREVRADELRKAAKEYSPTGMIGDVRKEVEDFASEVSKPADLDEEKTESARSDTSDTAQTASAAPTAAPASDAADTGTAPESEPAEPEAENAREDADAPDSAGKPAEDGSGQETLPESSEDSDGVASDAEPESGEPLEAERAESAPAEPPAAETNEAQSGTPEDGEPEPSADSRPAAVSGAEDADLTNGREAVETTTAPVTEGPETAPAERDERSTAP